MSYVPTVFNNGQAPGLSATEMNKIGNGIKTNADDIEKLQNDLSGSNENIAKNTSDISGLTEKVTKNTNDISELNENLSDNIFENAEIVVGKYVSNAGVEVSGSGYNCTKVIPYTNDNVVINYTSSIDTTWFGITCFDKNKKYIADSYKTKNDTKKEIVFPTVSGTKYIRISYSDKAENIKIYNNVVGDIKADISSLLARIEELEKK